MRIRSLKAARAWVACLALASFAPAPARAGDEPKKSAPPAVANTVRLEIQIAGLGARGGKVEIKPAHPGCKFKKVEKAIPKKAGGAITTLDPIAVEVSSTSPDRDCSFEITVTEPGLKPVTFRRGLQLAPIAEADKAKGKATAAPARTLKCYLPAAMIAAKDAPEDRPRR